jgi:hypothetical protein
MNKLKVRLGWLTRQLVPNTGTLFILALFFLVQSVVAKPSTMPMMPGATTMLLSYQGTLTDQSGDPINGDVEMVFALYHEAEGGTAFWTEAHTGTQAIEVIGGQFHVLLGSQEALDPADLTGDLYLGITVNGEEMLPRELLVSVVNAIQANWIKENLDMQQHSITNVGGGSVMMDIGTSSNNNHYFESRTGHTFWFGDRSGDERDAWMTIGSSDIDVYRSLNMSSNDIANLDGIQLPFKLESERSWEFKTCNSGSATRTALRSTSDDKYFQFRNQDDSTILSIYADNESGGHLGMNGHSVKNCGALTEANLQTPEELAAERIDRFEEGDVLCWAGERLEKCSTANDLLVQAVADVDGLPIVLGAEAVKVLGTVHYGDLLVASDVPGYAMVNNDDPRSGSVIAQALEDFDGEQGLIRAMIRKF